MSFHLLLSLLLVFTLANSLHLDSRTLNALKIHPNGYSSTLRVFHPAFPKEFLNPISAETAEDILKLKKSLGTAQNLASAYSDLERRGLPWKILPALGVLDLQNVMPKSEIIESYETYRHLGHIVWAHKLDKVEKGSIILNHWKQEAILITEYSPESGAQGSKITPLSAKNAASESYFWPPLTLEIEIRERKWQPVAVSDNILSGEVLSLLPPSMAKSPWELIFLLLLKSDDTETIQTLFDTGLSPRQGLIAYIRLLKQLELRTEAWDGVPSHRLITETDVEL